ncbi:gamma-glutamyltransferase family protein [Prosthecomicrobium pneumaticum]|uniref:Gamma-glutamyltranspeptidase/glutathione hydrolase n=1 Tax=Prosthecomicrobium pneumaticum TaxID=81895 RepID=A0A7W9CV75_9HYPH|nr:gamma-glutamyltransferase [Prosthecomicrobium pneumaticum]MBB5752512.1 gamma-glutamyltranspeptidase/glutathione hydrolase [Prosthecomicrobium pneumaticum]
MSETVVGEKGMVVAPHRAAAEAGAAILREGGNAVEAMLAAAATIAVVYPHMNGIGGDGFWLIREPGRTPRYIEACGAAGSGATIGAYREKGHDRVPTRGPDAALTVAGAVSGWALAHQFAASLGGRFDRRTLVEAAIGHARAGVAVSRSQARMTAEHEAELAPVPGFAAQFMPGGKAPATGDAMRFERLADTLDQLAHEGFEDFYRGDVGATIAADLAEAGAPVTRADLERQEARFREPLSLRIAGATLYNAPPPTQGAASLMILGLFERLGVARGEGFEHVHGLVEATKRAFQFRDARITDPVFAGDLAPYLSDRALEREAAQIDMRRAAALGGGGAKGDTVWLGAIDASGLAVSYIQSIFWEFGSGLTLPRTGIVWQNRGASFSLDPRALNPLEPGRKPFHTLNPPLARFDDGRVMSYGTMGGDGQPQFQAALFTRHVRFGMDLAEAIAAPRWLWGKTWGADAAGLRVESRLDADLVRDLERAGHRVEVLAEPYADLMGHAGAIVRRADGRLFGASDPRSDGAAVAG